MSDGGRCERGGMFRQYFFLDVPVLLEVDKVGLGRRLGLHAGIAGIFVLLVLIVTATGDVGGRHGL